MCEPYFFRIDEIYILSLQVSLWFMNGKLNFLFNSGKYVFLLSKWHLDIGSQDELQRIIKEKMEV